MAHPVEVMETNAREAEEAFVKSTDELAGEYLRLKRSDDAIILYKKLMDIHITNGSPASATREMPPRHSPQRPEKIRGKCAYPLAIGTDASMAREAG
jgi:hypothetical protein